MRRLGELRVGELHALAAATAGDARVVLRRDLVEPALTAAEVAHLVPAVPGTSVLLAAGVERADDRVAGLAAHAGDPERGRVRRPERAFLAREAAPASLGGRGVVREPHDGGERH